MRTFLSTLAATALLHGTFIHAQTTTPLLRVEGGMHAARIEDVVCDRAGQVMLTASHDKTARLWSQVDGRLLHVFRLPIGNANEGKLNAVALSPDGKVAAMAGLTGYEWDGKVSVYLFDVTSGRMMRRLTGLTNVVFDLAFSASGRFLAAGLGGGDGVRVWDVASGQLTGEVGAYGDNCHAVEWHGDNQLLTTCLKGDVTLYRVQGGSLARAGNREFAGMRPFGASISPDGQRVAVGFLDKPEVRVLSLPSLGPDITPDVSGITNGNLKAVRWSQDGTRLYGAGHWDEDGSNPVRTWDVNGRTLARDVSVHSNFIHALAAGGENAVAVAGGGPVWAQVEPGQVSREVPPPLAQWEHTFASFRCSPDGMRVSFAWSEDAQTIGIFDLGKRRLKPKTAAEELSGLDGPSRRGLDLRGWCSAANETERRHALAQGLRETDLGATNGSTQPQLRGQLLKLVTHDTSRCVAASVSGAAFTLGTDFRLTRYHADGTQLWSVQTPGITWMVTEASTAGLVIAGHNDGTIRWYREKDGQELLALFAHADQRRWVVWTPLGYFDCAPGSEDLVGWHVNRGSAEAADFFSIARFRGIYYRPDVIKRVLKTLDVPAALREANTVMGRPVSRPEGISEVLTRLSPPVVELESGGALRMTSLAAGASRVAVRYRVRNTGRTRAARVEVRFNGRPVDVAAPVPAAGGTAEVNVPVPDGLEGEISVIARHELASSEPAILQVRRPGQVAPGQPVLHLIAAGVAKLKANAGLPRKANGQVTDEAYLSQYEADGVFFNDLEHAHEDAARVGKLFDAEANRVFAAVKSKVLTNEQATTEALRQVLKETAAQASPGDVVVVSFSGHGYADEKHPFFLATHDVHPNRPEKTGLTGQELARLLGPIKARVILLLDTCQSGGVLGRQGEGGAITGPEDLTGLVNTLSGSDLGIIVLSSSSEEEFSYESGGGGLFTQAIAEGMSGSARRKSGEVSCMSLQEFVIKEVPRLVDANPELKVHGVTQTPSVIMPKGAPDFVLATP